MRPRLDTSLERTRGIKMGAKGVAGSYNRCPAPREV